MSNFNKAIIQMSKFNLKILLAIIVGIVKVVIDVLSGNSDISDNDFDITGVS